MNIEVLISTMNEKSIDCYKRFNLKTDALIINQTDHNAYEEISVDGNKIRMISTDTRGLGVSRNLALLNSNADIVVFCDDDEVFEDDYDKIILSDFTKHTDVDFFVFKTIIYQDGKEIIKVKEEKNLSIYNSLRYGSVHFAFKRESQRRKNIWISTYFGAGTEKLEEEVRNFFPNANILRMDSMTATNKNLYEMMYRDMKNNKIDILLGTQMIAKGLDFKNVSLVGIISADLSLNVGDFKANETTFQLLTQVSGRAGRDKIKGRVVIQTYRPDNFVIQAAKNNDYEAFYENELKLRRAFNYPPYKNILTIRVVNESRLRAVDISKKLYKDISKLLNNTSIELIGPNPCKIARINNKFRYNILIKVDDDGLNNVIDIINRLRIKYINKYKDTSFIPALNPTNIN